VSSKVEFTFSHIELLKNRSNFVSQIVKFTNFDVSRAAADEYVSGQLNIIDDVVNHFGCQLLTPVHLKRQNKQSQHTENWDNKVGL
jgi:hypothetical protein